uniref:Hemimethylated DNA-binding domain-containing protein n=1 Tax=Daphnia galeata TaxID=27404 RepID=A0A8J2RPU6_9CRUS|nr:unnamed protein product [Daphnia galeata]
MSLLSLSNEVLLWNIFSQDAISVTDLKSLMISCRTLYNIIRESDELWRLKFIERWGNFLSQLPNNKGVWFERTTLRCRKAKEVQKVVQNMSSIAYPVGQSPINVIDKLIAGPFPIPECVQNELEEMVYDKKIRENKTTFHYARDTLVKVRITILDKKWRDFMAQPKSQMSLFEGVALISQWSTMEHGKLQTCLKDLESSIENITKRVNEQMAEVLCASNAKPKKKAKNILDLITHVMFNEMGFKLLTTIYRSHLHFSCISQVLKRKEGCPTLLCAIYQEVARKMDIPCELVYCEKWDEEDDFMGSLMYRSKLLLRWKDSAGSKDDSIYIDVYRGGLLKKSSVYPFLKEQPAASVDSVVNDMVGFLTNSVWYALDEKGHEIAGNDRLFFARLACSMSPKSLNKVMLLAKLSFHLGIQLDDTIQLIQSEELKPDFNAIPSASDVLEQCISELNKQKAEITAAKFAHHRLSSIKFSVGLVVICNYTKWGRNFRNPCVIVSWNVKFQESSKWKSEVGSADDAEDEEKDEDSLFSNEESRSQPRPAVLSHLNESLELLPAAVAIKHDSIWIHFERFDGRRYVPNAEKRAQFPEDEAATLSLIG